MLQDKDIVNDYLNGLNASLKSYAGYISEANNAQLRQTLINLRNGDESRQRKVYSYSIQNGFYKPAQAASQQEIQQVQSELSAGQ
ncbi:MAG: spore coat protein [Bacillota bacterium]|uniref:Spore coat protein n=1 Tax=Virgibacillus salarius TaxID=447199 RepID=A0A941DQI8_9BACI|nr:MULTISPECIES: spore coat protein [Bacillaceae]NAZ07485.1 spore coat protein [Agaribacter marinus]MBR7794765.1 spore coat protein [Virgibacillus salarius]MCC2249839.1 spore coat protein [Virgibacillus sp. AGTR]QRZ19299.1 spore coat protein [Virgibacillus sp. AGTR]WBX81016.1 spore coat protein [Virgibacillus salarius]